MTRVTAPSRLHFGLLSLPGGHPDRWPGPDGGPGLPVRHFGGVGLMVDRPGLAVRVEPAGDWGADGPLAPRALTFAQRFVDSLPCDKRGAFRVTVEHAPAEHTGLGVGTQLGLAVARALAVESGQPDWPAAELAVRVGRGERSGIGVHGFDRGGLIVEGGKLPAEPLSPLVARLAFPADWSVLLVTPDAVGSWHGPRERAALAGLGPSPAETDALCRLVLTGLLPALAAADLTLFGEALYELNARAGDMFARVQGGRYSSPAVAECVSRLRRLGVRGAGQSSWGPTVFGIVPRADAAALAARVGHAILTRPSAGAETGRAGYHGPEPGL